MTLVGMKVRLDRPIDRERPCCSNICVIGAARGPHAGELICTGCNRHRGWLSKSTAAWIAKANEVCEHHFGGPGIITVRKSHLYAERQNEIRPDIPDKRRRVALINQQIAVEGFAPKNFLLTQAPPPEKKSDRAQWRARESRRRPIARQIALWGLTAHYLVETSSSEQQEAPDTEI